MGHWTHPVARTVAHLPAARRTGIKRCRRPPYDTAWVARGRPQSRSPERVDTQIEGPETKAPIMRAHRRHLALAIAAAALALLLGAGSALAHGSAKMSPMPGMTAEEHAAMTQGQTTEKASPMPGMSADEHAAMSHGDESMAMDDHATTAGRPVGLLLGGFVAINLVALVAAAIARRRGPAAKRRAAKARVRAAAVPSPRRS
jgi:hypothetical protein